MNEKALRAARHEKDEFFKRHPQSPLTPEQRAKFEGLTYFEPNAALDLTIAVQPFAEQTPVKIQTSTGDIRTYKRYGEVRFMVDEQEQRLTIYETPHGYFLPFVDSNADGDTYGAGRYIDPEPVGGGKFHVDFNQAYNPTCVYGDGWSCPITPAENRLKVAIRAGEKMPQGEWVTSH
ncbi:MAG: DUF1684 domain-containing protein [Anaerolineae bacterium]